MENKTRQRAYNPVTLETLRKSGADLCLAHKIVNVFYVFQEANVDLLLAGLSEKGFQLLEINKMEDAKKARIWCLHAQLVLIPELESLNLMTDGCIDLAASVEGEYDGWYTSPEQKSG